MLAEIITIGDEILIGQTIDTNSAWLGEAFSKMGIDVVQITSINDQSDAIVNALKAAEARSDVIILTGGLGPTKDDITKKTLAKYFDTDLVLHQETLDVITSYFGQKGRPVLQVHVDQALVPANCEVIPNTRGTAPGLLFERNGKIIISFPGVPYEMKSMMTKYILPRLESKSQVAIVHKTISVIDIPESTIAETIANVESALPNHIKLAFLPHLNIVRLRLSAKSKDKTVSQLEAELHEIFEKIQDLLGDAWFEGDEPIATLVGRLLTEMKMTIGTIESCSGGKIAHTLTGIPGSSAYYTGSLLTYAYEAKVALADIPQEMLNKYGAVSEEVAFLMAKNAKAKLDVDYCISTTGIAGPTGGTDTKPVGLVYIGLAKPDGSVNVKKCFFFGKRLQVIERTSITALDMIRKALLN